MTYESIYEIMMSNQGNIAKGCTFNTKLMGIIYLVVAKKKELIERNMYGFLFSFFLMIIDIGRMDVVLHSHDSRLAK